MLFTKNKITVLPVNIPKQVINVGPSIIQKQELKSFFLHFLTP